MNVAPRWLRILRKPEYLWQPNRVLMALKGRSAVAKDPSPRRVERLPWGMELEVDPRENVGRSISRTGVHDLVVAEALWRLQQPADRVLDVGANIGFMCAVMAHRASTSGKVEAFEPHPELYRRLLSNVARWPAKNVRVHQLALSNSRGTGYLEEPSDFMFNQGRARMSRTDINESNRKHRVETACLDEWNNDQSIGCLKIDIEGHELAMLQGAKRLLGRQAIRDIVFEDFGQYPTDVTDYLEARDYTLFKLDKGFLGPIIERASNDLVHRSLGSPTFLATVDPVRARRLLSPKGWYCLGAPDLAGT